jgi:hypothetical protein
MKGPNMKRKTIIIFLIIILLNSLAHFSWSASLPEEAFNGNIEKVQELLKQGSDVNQTIEGGQTALMLAAYKGYEDIVKLLLSYQANVNIARKDNMGTALHAAVSGNNKDIVAMLLNNDANVNAKTASGQTSLMIASSQGYLDIVDLLLSESSVNWRSKGIDIDDQDKDGFTALMYAVSKNHISTVKDLVAAGADLKKKTKMGLSVLGISQMASSEMNNYISSLFLNEKPTNVPVKDPKIIEQAKPIYNLFKSIKKSDFKLFKTVFSPRIRLRFKQEGWKKIFNSYKNSFKKDFGNFVLDDFAYSYNGNENSGKVSVKFKGQEKGSLLVYKEGNAWKMDEK